MKTTTMMVWLWRWYLWLQEGRWW